jgi:effector-binding domain-containing protein/type III secretory pathway component EscS
MQMAFISFIKVLLLHENIICFLCLNRYIQVAVIQTKTQFMNKTITIILGIIVVFVIVFVIAAFLGPQGFKMERSIVINAPRETIYKNISDYRNWIKWSPWAHLDSNAKYDYYGTQRQIGAGYRWKGNADAGEGDMHTVAMDQNSNLLSKLTFLKPLAIEAMTSFTLTDTGTGATKLTWGFSQEFGFFHRPMMLVLNMEKVLGPDYEKGLANLKSLSERMAADQPAYKVREIDWAAHTYVADRAMIDMEDLGKIFMDKMPKVFAYVQKNKLQMDGAPSGLYFTWDVPAGKTDMAVAIPVKDASKVSGSYTAVTVAASGALMVDYYGPYDKMKAAHDAIQKYAADKGLKLKSPVIEEYIGDPGVEKDPNKVLTRIYYLIDK